MPLLGLAHAVVRHAEVGASVLPLDAVDVEPDQDMHDEDIVTY